MLPHEKPGPRGGAVGVKVRSFGRSGSEVGRDGVHRAVRVALVLAVVSRGVERVFEPACPPRRDTPGRRHPNIPPFSSFPQSVRLLVGPTLRRHVDRFGLRRDMRSRSIPPRCSRKRARHRKSHRPLPQFTRRGGPPSSPPAGAHEGCHGWLCTHGKRASSQPPVRSPAALTTRAVYPPWRADPTTLAARQRSSSRHHPQFTRRGGLRVRARPRQRRAVQVRQRRTPLISCSNAAPIL